MDERVLIQDRHKFIVLTEDEFIEVVKFLCPNGVQEILIKGERFFIFCHDKCIEEITNAIHNGISFESPINIKNRKP